MSRYLSSRIGLMMFSAVFASDVLSEENSTEFFSMSLEELLRVEITVASLLDSDEMHAASNVSVVNASDWQRYGARRALDAIEHLPATLVLPFINGTQVIAIRGYAQSTSARGIATSLDGIRLNNYLFGTAQYEASDFNLGVLDRMEMIRGPASAIYGSDAFHGVLAMHAFESPTDVNQVKIEGGDKGYHRLSARHSGQVSDAVRLNLALAGSGQSNQDHRYDLDGDPLAGDSQYVDKEQRFKSKTLSLKLASDSDQDWSWNWGLYGDQIEADDFPSSSATYEAGQNVDNVMSRLALTRRLDQGSLVEVSTYYRDSDVERFSVAPVGAFFPGGNNILEEHSYGAAISLKQQHQSRTQWAVVLGYDVQVVDKADLYIQMPQGGFDSDVIELIGGSRSQNIGSLVLEASSKLGASEEWTLVYGGRLDHYSSFGVQGSPSLGLIYQYASDSAIKLLYGKAFRAPTAAELYLEPINNVGSIGNPGLDPEIMDTVELVLLKQAETWKANLVLFENRWKETISYIPISAGLGGYFNSGRSSAYGLEVSLTWLPRPWAIDFNASYTESRNEETGEEYTLFPKMMANLSINYHWDSQHVDFTLINRVFSSVEERGGFVVVPPEDTPTYWRTDLAVSKRFSDNVEAFLNILNVLDRDNYLPSISGIENGIPDQPLSASVGLNFSF